MRTSISQSFASGAPTIPRAGARTSRKPASTRWPAALFLVCSLAACSRILPPILQPSRQSSPKITSAHKLIAAMHDRYAGNWYRTLRFTQSNTFYTPSGGEQRSRWIETLSVPGRLRIDFEPLSSKSGLLISNNQVMTFDNGRRIDTRTSVQAILALTSDVYAVPPSVTLRRLDSFGADLSKFREDRFERKRVYVIGGGRDNAEANQVWIDADKLLLVRLVQREKRGSKVIVTDTRVGNYRDVDGYPVPHEFVSLRDGKRYLKEVYENVRVNAPISDGAFDPSRWSSAQPAG